MSLNIQAVIFDLDGVLVDTRVLHYEALSLALKDLNLELDFNEHLNFYDGLPTYRKIEMLTDKFHLSSEQVSFLNQKKQDYTMILLDGKITPNEEHSLILSYLKSKNIRTAICSNTKRSTLDYIIKKLDIENQLEFSLSNEDVSTPKPSPEIYLKALDLLKVSPHATVVFEDSPHGLESARKALVHVEQVKDSLDLTFDRIKKLIK